MNKEAFEFILNRNLYSIEGQEDFLNKNLAVDFPVDAKEIKAAWRMFTDVELDPAKTFRISTTTARSRMMKGDCACLSGHITSATGS